MQLSQMRYFLEIARTGNISAAARKLYLSQPSLSQAIRNLEEELDIQLLVRHSKSVSLTDAGEQFAAQAERIIGSVDQLNDLMQRNSQLLFGRLRLGIPWVAGYLGIFTLLRRFHQAMPGVEFKLTADGSIQLLKQLDARQIHGGFMITTPGDLVRYSDCYFKKINEEQYMALVPKDHPLSEKAELSVQDLDGQTLIMPAQNTSFSQQLNQAIHSAGISTNTLCETSHADIVSQLAGEGLGIGFSSTAAYNCPESCRAVPLTEKITRTIYYVTLKELLDYPMVKSFTNYVEHYNFRT